MNKKITICLFLFVTPWIFFGCGQTQDERIYRISEASYIDLSTVTRLQATIEFGTRSFPLSENGIKKAVDFIHELSSGNRVGGARVLVNVMFDGYKHHLYYGEDFIDFPDENGPNPELIQKIETEAAKALDEFREITIEWSEQR